MPMASDEAREMAGGVSVTRPRLDEKPWGGRKLARYGLDLPPGAPVGEALVTADDAEIVSGAGAGMTLAEVIAAHPELLGPAASRAVSRRAQATSSRARAADSADSALRRASSAAATSSSWTWSAAGSAGRGCSRAPQTGPAPRR